jgi:cytochrome P450
MDGHASLKVDLGRVAPATEHWKEIDELREQYRYFRNTCGPGYWVLTRYEDIREAFQNPEVFCNHSIVPTDPDPAYRFLPSFSDPPQHMKYRHTMNKWFAPAAVANFSPDVQRLARETVTELVGDGSCDYLATFGDRYPVRVFLLSMGLGQEDAEFFVSCVRRMSGATSGKPDDVEQMMGAWNDIAEYWTKLLADRREHPLDPEVDFVTHMSRATLDDEPMPDIDIVDILVTLTLGSLDTLKSQLGWCMYHLATHPEDRRRVVESPGLIPGAVEEFLRAYPIVGMARKVTRDVDFHGCPMKKDDMVLLTIQAATRDPRVFPDADQVIIDRQPNRHIAFGASEHRCLGSHLARAEMKYALEEWHRAIPEYRVATDEPLMAHGGQVSLLSLPLAWDV